MLIVLDDVTDYKAIEPYLPPSDPRFKLLITTRLKLGSSVKDFLVEELKEESAITLLESFVNHERVQADIDDVKVLCKRVGYLPLGLEILGRFLARKLDWSVRKLLEQLASKSLAAKALIETEFGMTAQLGVAEALELSWQELNESEQQLACLLGLFAVSPIPWSLVEQAFGSTDPEELENTRDDGLTNRNLVKRVGQETYQLHQVIQEYFRIKLHQRSDQGQELKESFCRVIVGIAKNIGHTPTIDQIEGVRNAIAHLEEVANQWNEMLSDQDLAWPCTGVGRFYEGQGKYEMALPWLQKCLEQCQRRFGQKHPHVAICLNNLALLYSDQGQYEEVEMLYKQALEIYQELFGNEHYEVATSLHNLAEFYDNQGRYKEAESLYKQSLEMRQRLLGKEHPHIADSFNNLARLYTNQSRYKEAEPLYIKALEINRKTLGDEHPAVENNFYNLATLYFMQHRYKEAKLFIKKSQKKEPNSKPEN